MRELAAKKRNNEKLKIRVYAVAFIDVLGAANELMKFQTSFEHKALGSDPDNTALILAIMRMIRPIEWMRQAFHDYFAKAQDWSPTDRRWRQLSRVQQNNIRRVTKVRVDIQAVSDCLILSVPLEEPASDHFPIGSLSALITGCATMIPTMLAGSSAMAPTVGKAIRGGIAAGAGIEYFRNEWTTSTGYYRAYTLESREAKWPRIVIDDGIVAHIQSYLVKSENSDESRIAQMLARRAMEVISQDEDGLYFIDFLSQSLREEFGGYYEAVLAEAYHFIRMEHDRFVSESCMHIAEKYAWLVAHFDRKAPEFKRGYESGTLPRMVS